MNKRTILFLLLPVLIGAFIAQNVFAAGTEEVAHGAGAQVFLWIAVILILAKLSSLIEKWGQPSVLGELVMGIVLGNIALLAGYLGLHQQIFYFFEPIKTDSIITFLAELGVVILLFQIGLESNIHKMRKVGGRALLVAIIGVVAPFLLGTYIVGPLLLPGLASHAYLFLGAALSATSVGITARVFRDLRKLQSPESQIVLGAAVFDDVIGLIILAVISALVTVGAVSAGLIGIIVAKAILFLVGSIILGQLFAGHIGALFSKINTGVGMKFTLALSIGLLFAYVANVIGLAPIVGAFAAGLVLDSAHFRFFRNPVIVGRLKKIIEDAQPGIKERILKAINQYSYHHIEDLIEPLSYLLVPIFFISTGMQVNLSVLFQPSILIVALGITVVAIIGKIVAGLVAGNVNKWIVGWGMVPRGEVGLIFATIGKSLGVVSDEVFSVIIIMVVFTTLLPPPILSFLIKRQSAKEKGID